MAEQKKCKECVEFRKRAKTYFQERFVTYFTFSVFIMFGLLYVFVPILPRKIIFTCTTMLLSTFVILYISKLLVGKYYYFFKDKDGNIHCHTQKPILISDLGAYCWKQPSGYIAKWDAEEYLVKSAILRIKLGGWLKINRVFADLDKNLTSSTWTAWDYVRIKKKKIEIGTEGGLRISCLEPKQALEIINSFYDMEQLISVAKQSTERKKQIKTLEKQLIMEGYKLLDSQQRLNYLAYSLIKMLAKIYVRHQSMGKSKHARELRVDIERTLVHDVDFLHELKKLYFDRDIDARQVIQNLMKKYKIQEPDDCAIEEQEENLPQAANG